MRRPLAVLTVAVLLLVHGAWILAAWGKAYERTWGADFASYYYAVEVASEGGNPYDTAALGAAARSEGTRGSVFPFFYPPPFLLVMAWVLPMALHPAYLAWFWLDELFAVLCALILWRWWRPLGTAVPWLAAGAVATLTAIPDNHAMGQVNLPVIALVLGGIHLAEEERVEAGGALVGLACMLKMSPALFVAWWAVRGRWRAVAWACATAVALTALSLLLAGPAVQADFYLRVLPGFGSGDYNGLTVPISLYGNYSLPELYHRIFPSGEDALSGPARVASAVTGVALIGGLGAAFRKAPSDLGSLAAQVGAICVTMLLIPVYTYEHHLVWGIPAVVAAGAAILSGRLGRGWLVAVVPAWVAWAWSLPSLKAASGALSDWPALALGLREVKTAALVVLLVACVAAVRSTRAAREGGTVAEGSLRSDTASGAPG